MEELTRGHRDGPDSLHLLVMDAAVVARQLGKVCLVGCAELQFDESARTITLGEITLHEGDMSQFQ